MKQHMNHKTKHQMTQCKNKIKIKKVKQNINMNNSTNKRIQTKNEHKNRII